MTYWLINIPFLVVAAVVLGVALGRKATPRGLPWVISAVVMMALTAVFDNAIIGTGLVAYDSDLLSGVMVGLAPIEDFAYTVAALMLIPALWHLLERRGPESS
jgi:lycopene cyclase domain-containing protein